MSKVLTASDYKIVDNADLFLAALATGSNVPEEMTVTTTASASTSVTTIAVSALSDPLYEGQILKFGAVKVRLAADAAAGATSISVVSIPSTIANAASTTTYVLVPIYAVKTFDRSTSERTETFSTFNTKAGRDEELILGRGDQISCAGYTVASNPGLIILKTANGKTGKGAQVYFEFIRDDDAGYKGFGNVKGFRETNQVQKAIEIQWNFGVSGELYDIDDTIDL